MQPISEHMQVAHSGLLFSLNSAIKTDLDFDSKLHTLAPTLYMEKALFIFITLSIIKKVSVSVIKEIVS